MNRTNVEYIIGHGLGVSQSYYKPLERDVLADYLKAVDLLTINKDHKTATLLQKQVAELVEKNEEANQIISTKLAEKENEIESMKIQFKELQQRENQMIKTAANMERVNDWLNENVPEQIERLIREYIEPDPAQGSSITAKEYVMRRREFPELVRAAKRLQKLRLANSSQNNKRKKK